MSKPQKSSFDLLLEQIRTVMREEIRVVVVEELARALRNNDKPPASGNELLRDIAHTLDVDAIKGFKVVQGIVCWNCVSPRDEARRV